MSTALQAESIVQTAGKTLQPIGEKIISGERISPEEGLLLFEKAPLPFVGTLANYINIDSATGNLSLIGTANYKVGGNKYAFQYSGNANYGLFFNSTNVRYEFRNSVAAATFFVGADNGNGYFLGNLGLGTTTAAAKLDVIGKIKMTDGTQGVGKILTSDANGLARWATPAVLPWTTNGNDIFNIPDIRRENISGDKSIYNIYLYNNNYYLSAGLGVIVLDGYRFEVNESWFIGNGGNTVKVNGFTSDAGFYYAATDEGLKRANVHSTDLANHANWTLLSGANGLAAGSCRNVMNLEGHIVAEQNDSLFILNVNLTRLPVSLWF